MTSLDLTSQKVIAQRDVSAAVKAGAGELVLQANAVVTPAARDLARKHGLVLRNGIAASACSKPVLRPSAASGRGRDRILHSAQAEAAKEEIVAGGRKLWQRQYVDGNGGNISCRIGEDEVLCTPTLLSKADLRPEDLCLVDLAGNQIVGSRPRNSRRRSQLPPMDSSGRLTRKRLAGHVSFWAPGEPGQSGGARRLPRPGISDARLRGGPRAR